MKYIGLFFLWFFLLPFLFYYLVYIFKKEKETQKKDKYSPNDPIRHVGCEKFSAFTDCPQCGFMAVHRIKDTLPKSCRRICSECNYVWRQT